MARKIYEIANDIRREYARPYLNAMSELSEPTDELKQELKNLFNI